MIPEQTWTAAKAVAAERGIEWTLPEELPEKVDPQLKAFREFAQVLWPHQSDEVARGEWDGTTARDAFDAGAAYVRSQQAETFEEAWGRLFPNGIDSAVYEKGARLGFQLARGEVGK